MAGAVALVVGTWAPVYCRLFVVEIVERLIALGLVTREVPAIAIGVRKKCRVKNIGRVRRREKDYSM